MSGSAASESELSLAPRSLPPFTRRNVISPAPDSPASAAATGLPDGEATSPRPALKTTKGLQDKAPYAPVSASMKNGGDEKMMSLELEDGTVYRGYSFGNDKSIGGELVFQTGMVGYPESVTDPSYRGQILVITFPLVGNYGVPSRQATDGLLPELPAHFEAAEIHIAGLVVASYSGEDFSHHLAISSLGAWLKEQGVPAMYGVDTRALTKKIREQGSMLGKMLLQTEPKSNGFVNGLSAVKHVSEGVSGDNWRTDYEQVDWVNPNTTNLVADG